MSATESKFEYKPPQLDKSDIPTITHTKAPLPTGKPEVKKEPSSRARMLASYSATIFGVTATSPIDVLKTRLQVQHDKGLGKEMYTRIHHSFIKMWKQEGIQGMFKGYRATVV
jgi:hypothetical protein